MTRSQRGIREKKRHPKIKNPDSRKGRSSKKDKFKSKNERQWNY